MVKLSMLHALGLLDDDEREAFEEAFNNAPKDVQALVVNEANRMSDLGDLLPHSEPNPHIRALVVEATRAAIREGSTSFQDAKLSANRSDMNLLDLLRESGQRIDQQYSGIARQVHKLIAIAGLTAGLASSVATAKHLNTEAVPISEALVMSSIQYLQEGDKLVASLKLSIQTEDPEVVRKKINDLVAEIENELDGNKTATKSGFRKLLPDDPVKAASIMVAIASCVVMFGGLLNWKITRQSILMSNEKNKIETQKLIKESERVDLDNAELRKKLNEVPRLIISAWDNDKH